jgi:hypothetical integral membrane protein (TIGR02206 family)
VIIAFNCLFYRRLDEKGRARWKKIVALLIVADELFKMVMLTIGGRYEVDYLPLHLCSINIFLIAFHAWRPNRTVGGFLYTVCIPGAIAAMLFPTWTSLPVGNFMHLHSFTVHILLIMYPMVLVLTGETKPQARELPKYLALLAGLGLIALIANLLLDTNFMFLMYAEEGNPLLVFENLWGSHLLGFPVLITAVLIVMYVPMGIYRKLKKK